MSQTSSNCCAVSTNGIRGDCAGGAMQGCDKLASGGEVYQLCCSEFVLVKQNGKRLTACNARSLCDSYE